MEVGCMKFFEKVKIWFASLWQKIVDGWNWLVGKVKGFFRKKDPSEDAEPKAPKAPKVKRPDGEKSLFEIVCFWLFRFRAVFMAIPVLFVAILQAVDNMAKLPEKVAFYVPLSQQELLTAKAIEFSRNTAVYFPLNVTIVCLLLMCCSRRTVFPWLVSIFTLVLPLFFRYICVLPG